MSAVFKVTEKDLGNFGKIIIAVLVIWLGSFWYPVIAPYTSQLFLSVIFAVSLQKGNVFLQTRFNLSPRLAVASIIGAGWLTGCIILTLLVFYMVNTVDSTISLFSQASLESMQGKAIDLLTSLKVKYEWSQFIVDKGLTYANSEYVGITAILETGGIAAKTTKFVASGIAITVGYMFGFIKQTIIISIFIAAFLLYGKTLRKKVVYLLSFVVGTQNATDIIDDLKNGIVSLTDSMFFVGLGQGGLGILIITIYAFFFCPVPPEILIVVGVISIASSACGVSLSAVMMVGFAALGGFIEGQWIASIALLPIAFFVGTVADQWIRHKVLGSGKLKVAPVVMVVSMFAGMVTYGFLGLFLLPCLVVFFKATQVALMKIVEVTKNTVEDGKELLTEAEENKETTAEVAT